MNDTAALTNSRIETEYAYPGWVRSTALWSGPGTFLPERRGEPLEEARRYTALSLLPLPPPVRVSGLAARRLAGAVSPLPPLSPVNVRLPATTR